MKTGINKKLLVIGAAVAVAITATVVMVYALRDKAIHADGNGGAAMDLPGLPFHLQALPGTFQPNQPLVVSLAKAPLEVSGARFVAPPVSFSPDHQPAHPLILDTKDAYDVDPDLTVGVLWDENTKRVEFLAVEKLADGRLRASIPHFSGFGFLTFQSVVDLGKWIAGSVYEGVKSFWNNLWDVAYECATPKLDSSVLDIWQTPDSVSLQLDVRDSRAIAGSALLEFCNKHRFVYAFTAGGAGRTDGFALPRSTLAVDVAMQGNTGDAFTVNASVTPVAMTMTGLLLALSLLPSGTTVAQYVMQKGVLDPSTVTLISNAAQSCGSSITAALGSTNAGLWAGMVSCWVNQTDFVQAVTNIFVKKALELGMKAAADFAKKPGSLRLALADLSFIRIDAELLAFGVPRDVTFAYRLRCTVQPGTGCPPRTGAAPPTGASPTGAPAASAPATKTPTTKPPTGSPSGPSFVYPVDGQTLDLEGAYLFKVSPVPNATGYLYGFFQDGSMVWENQRDEGTLSGTEYGIHEGSPGHSHFHAGDVQVWVRALVNGAWTNATIITITLRPRQ